MSSYDSSHYPLADCPKTLADSVIMPGKLRHLVQAQKPDIKIAFTSHQKTYTTLDRIEGTATVTAPVDTNFDAIDVEFVGTSRTYVERLTTAAAASGRSEAFHQFLKLSQPGMHHYYPTDRILKAGVSYEFPFIFNVPQQLLPRVCRHNVKHEAVRDAHLRLPPTFGDKDLAVRQKSLDDMAPEMASVRYGIFAKVTEVKIRGDEAFRATLSSKARRVRVIPVMEEQPPLDVHLEDGDYVMHKEKLIRKGVLKGKLGTLSIQSQQPQALQVRSYSDPDARTNSMATVTLRFDPLEESSPLPKLGNLATKLKVTTFFGSTARQQFPTRAASSHDMSQGMHAEQMTLSSRTMGNVEWTKHSPSEMQQIARRDSTFSTSSGGNVLPEASEGYKGTSYYTTRLVVPIQLPANKAFVPTFHSCLISRVYALKFDLSINSLGFGPNMELKVPVQISTQDLIGDDLERRDSIEAASDGEIDVEDVSNFFTNFFEPRTIRVPGANLIGRSRIGSTAPVSEHVEEPRRQSDAPPDYSPMADGTTARMTHHRAMSVPVY